MLFIKRIHLAILFLYRDMKPENILLDDQGKSLPCVLLIVDVLASSQCTSDHLSVD